MSKIVLAFIGILILVLPVIGQTNSTALTRGSKPLVDIEAIEGWVSIGEDGDVRISSDGRYFSYSIAQGALPVRRAMIVKSATGTWKQEVTGGWPGYFSSDSKQYVLLAKEKICFVELGQEIRNCIEGVQGIKAPVKMNPSWIGYKFVGRVSAVVLKHLLSDKSIRYDSVASYEFDKSGRWLLCKLQNAAHELVVYDLETNREYRYSDVGSYAMAENGNVLILQSKKRNGRVLIERISPGKKRDKLWEAADSTESIISLVLGKSGDRLHFTVEQRATNKSNRCLWYYHTGMASPERKVYEGMSGTEGMLIEGSSFVGDYIVFQLKERDDVQKVDVSKAKVEVWAHLDTLIQPVQRFERGPRSFLAVIKPDESRMIRLEHPGQKASLLLSGHIVLSNSYRNDRLWEAEYGRDSNWVLRLSDGKKAPLKGMGSLSGLTSSPQGRYIIYFDKQSRNYYSYDIQSGVEFNISASLPAGLLTKESLHYSDSAAKSFPLGIAGWLSGDEAVFVYDDYDIWQLDLSGRRPAVCVTNGYGRRHNRSLYLSDGLAGNRPVLRPGEKLLLSCYDNRNRYNGFYRQVIGSNVDPEELYMGPYCFNHISNSSALGGQDFDNGMAPVKATAADVWIVKRQSVTEAPNYFVTSDFKSYSLLTDLNYHKQYNWLNAEIVSFKQTDGKLSEGILYKPENFDPNRKYPVLINYYIKFTHRLYQYPRPEYMKSATMTNVLAYYVSRGYLVFTPDIYGRHARDVDGCLAAVEGACKHLSGFPYVDSSRIGILGHSIGGAKTMYLITHSRMFAAAFAGAAPRTDWVSNALGLSNLSSIGEQYDMLDATENAVGSNIWTDLQRWSKDNPVMLADKVTMPLLIYHGEKDEIPLSQPLEMYLALRRLEKPVWLLNYNESSHVASGRSDTRDLTIRASQYFDHYLKGEPAALWMTKGIPAKYKQIENRYELDLEGACGMYGCPNCSKNE